MNPVQFIRRQLLMCLVRSNGEITFDKKKSIYSRVSFHDGVTFSNIWS